MVKTARTNPARFLCDLRPADPAEVRLTVQQPLPCNLSAEDWAMMREIVDALKQAIPDASSQASSAVLQHVVVAKLRD